MEWKRAELENQIAMTKQSIREEQTNFNDLKKYAQSNSCGRLEMNIFKISKINDCGSSE